MNRLLPANKLFAVNAADSLKNNPRVYADGWTFGISLAAVRADPLKQLVY